MASRKIIKGILHNFVESYSSRYSDYDGYWLFGLLISDLDQLNINLIQSERSISEIPTIRFAVQLAAAQFKQRMESADIDLSCMREAYLSIIKLPDSVGGLVNGRSCTGHEVKFIARVVSDMGKVYEYQKSVFVAPHNARTESRSSRRT